MESSSTRSLAPPPPFPVPPRIRTSNWLERLSAVLLLLALGYAPWAMGCNPPWAIVGLEFTLGLAVICWIASFLFERRVPQIPLACLLACLLLLGGGWALTFNAHSTFDGQTHWFDPVEPPLSIFPGTVDRYTSTIDMVRISILLLTLWLVIDLTRCPRWRRRLLATVSLTGASIALLGMLQKIGLPSPVLQWMRPHEGIPFATFNYHANAGAFLNLALAAPAALVLAAKHQGVRLPRLHLACFATLAVAVFFTDSKAAMALAVLEMLALGWIAFPLGHSRSRKWFPLAAGLLLACTAGIFLTNSRWRSFPQELSTTGTRPTLWRIGLGIFSDAPFFGQGPGTFKLLLNNHSPHFDPALYSKWIYQDYTPGQRVSMWSQLHQDYLQTLIEWGVVGSLAWAALLWPLVRLANRPKSLSAAERIVLQCAGIALLTTLLHSWVDFPLQLASLQLYALVYLGLLWSSRTRNVTFLDVLPNPD